MLHARYAICVGLALLGPELAASAQSRGAAPDEGWLRLKAPDVARTQWGACGFQPQAPHATDGKPASKEPASKEPVSKERPASKEQVAQWLRDLDDDHYAVREAATAALSAAGNEAIAPLTKAAAGESLEVTVRCVRILERLAGDNTAPADAARADAALAALESLAPPRQTPAAERAAAALSRLYAKQAGRAKKQLYQLGVIHGSGENFIRKDVQRENHLLLTKKRWTGKTDDLRLFAYTEDITYLSIHGIPLGADALPHLTRLRHLESLELYGTGLDAASIAKLRAALPNLRNLDIRSGGVLGVSRFGPANCELREIMLGSPAAKAGLRPLDVVSQIDGHPLETYRALISYLATRTGGDKVKLAVERDGKKLEVEVTLGSWGDE